MTVSSQKLQRIEYFENVYIENIFYGWLKLLNQIHIYIYIIYIYIYIYIYIIHYNI